MRFHGLLCEKGSADRYIDDKAYRPSEVLDQRDEHTDGQSVEEAVEESDFEASMVSAPVGGVSPLNIPTSPGARPTNCEVLSDPWLAFILGMASMGLVWAGSLII